MLIHSPNALALLVKIQRKKLRLTQQMVGDRVGLKQQTISAFEKNPAGAEIQTLFRILAAVELDVYAFAKKETPVISLHKVEW